MTDLEMTKLCAEAMGLDSAVHYGGYEPLKDDAQAMALVKRFDLSVWGNRYAAGDWKYHAEFGHPDDMHALGHGTNHNRAIVECVAKMQASVSLQDNASTK